jgi:ribosomal protein S17E
MLLYIQLMDEFQKQDRAHTRSKYLRTDKSKKCRNIGCYCTRCFSPISKKIYNEKELKKDIIFFNKNYPLCEFI